MDKRAKCATSPSEETSVPFGTDEAVAESPESPDPPVDVVFSGLSVLEAIWRLWRLSVEVSCSDSPCVPMGSGDSGDSGDSGYPFWEYLSRKRRQKRERSVARAREAVRTDPVPKPTGTRPGSGSNCYTNWYTATQWSRKSMNSNYLGLGGLCLNGRRPQALDQNETGTPPWGPRRGRVLVQHHTHRKKIRRADA
jgi:hypothetical protein